MKFEELRRNEINKSKKVICLFLVLGLSACTYKSTLRNDFYNSSSYESVEKIPLKIGLIQSSRVKTLKFNSEFGKDQRANINYFPGIIGAIKAELETIFNEVTLFDHPAQAKEELLVYPVIEYEQTSSKHLSGAADYKTEFKLLFKEKNNSNVISQYSASPYNVEIRCKTGCQVLRVMTDFSCFTLSPITFPLDTFITGYDIKQQLKDGISGQIKEISEQILSDKNLLAYAKRKSHKSLVVKTKDIYNGKVTSSIKLTELPKHQDESTHKIQSERWAVIIGISTYQDTRIPPLRYASADAKAFYDWIVSPDGGKYAPSRVKFLVEKEATGKNIKTALNTWLKQPIEEDIVTIYFAGHGSADSPDSLANLFLYPYDTQYNNVAATGFPMWDIETALKRFIKAKKIIVVADACHAGGVGQPFDITQRDRGIEVNPISTGLQNLSKVNDGICVISASGDKQLSKEGKEWGGGHGVFTHFLLKGLKGEADYNKDERVTLGELIPFLSEQVRRETRNAQSPTVAGKFDPALSIER
jgi:hypothetical protein